MSLRIAHIVLMSASIALGIVMVIYGIHRFASRDQTDGLALAAAGAALSVGVGFYLRAFVAKKSG